MSIAKRIIPLLDRVLIQRFKPLEKTASGLLLPKAAQPTLNEGCVVAVGPGTSEHKMSLSVGDRVVLPAFGGMSVKLEGDAAASESATSEEEYLLFKESEILAKVNQN
jgi:chaperonin GroES